MKNIAITIFILFIVVVLGLQLISFQVREIETAMVTTFGKPTREIKEPGFYLKWPLPIERVYKFDSRMRVFEGDLGETTTKGTDPIIVNTYIVWKIAEPLEYFNAVGTIKEAENKLLSRLTDVQNKIIGQHDFSEFVNSDPDQIRLEQIQEQMLADLKQSVIKDYGIEIKALGIKQLKVSKDVTKDVFGRMRSDKNRQTLATISQGQAEAKKIMTDADSKKIELLAAAEARAKAIRGKGDAEAAQYYKMLEADPELAMFLSNVEALKKILKKRTTIVLSADSEPFKLLREMPEIKSGK